MTKKPKRAQQYSAEEFDQVVNLLTNDASLRADIEAITGQTLQGKSPRELFDLFRAVDQAAAVQLAVAKFGKARRLVREVRGELAADEVAHLADNPSLDELTRRRLVELETKLDELKGRNARLEAANKTLIAGRTAAPVAPRVIKGQVS